jgi:hypothetical protein
MQIDYFSQSGGARKMYVQKASLAGSEVGNDGSDAGGIEAMSRSVERSDTTGWGKKHRSIPTGC